MKSPVHPNFQRKPSSQGGHSAPLAPRGFSVSVATWGALASAAAVVAVAAAAALRQRGERHLELQMELLEWRLAQLDTGLSDSLSLSLSFSFSK